MSLYSYVVRWDHGFAPNPFFGVCSLATCKPGIRKGAEVGDWILGTGSAERHFSGRVTFLMRVAERTTFNAYWDNPQFASKKPVLRGSYKLRFGDNIYHRPNVDQPWVQADSRHSQHGAVANMDNLQTDTGTTDTVLLGTDFIYWGEHAPPLPEHFAHFAMRQPGYRYDFAPAEVDAFLAWARGFGQSGRVGNPLEWQFASRWK